MAMITKVFLRGLQCEFITMELQELHGNIYPLFSYFPSNSHSLLRKAYIINASFFSENDGSFWFEYQGSLLFECDGFSGEYDGTVSNTMAAFVSNTMLGSGSNTMLGKFSVGQCPAPICSSSSHSHLKPATT